MPQLGRLSQIGASTGQTGLPSTAAKCISEPMIPPSPLDDPTNAAHAWARYRRLMRLMALLTLVTVILVLAVLYAQNGPISVHFYIATALAVGLPILLTSALMGLVFLSSATGHDESIIDPTADDKFR